MPGKPAEEHEISKRDLEGLRQMLDGLWSRLGIDFEFTSHFLDRVNDPRNNKQITVSELQRLFSQSYERYKEHFKKYAEHFKHIDGVMADLRTKINAPFDFHWTPMTHHLELAVKSVMRTPDFHLHPGQQKFVVAHRLLPFKAWLKEHRL